VELIEALEARARVATDGEEVKAAIRELDEWARPFVERIMNRAIEQAAVGHRMEDFG
jgi:hypothetical protein